MSHTNLVTATALRLHPDPSRVVARLFVPGQEFAGVEDPQRTGVAARVLALDDDDVEDALLDLLDRFTRRHDDLEETFLRHGRIISSRVHGASSLTRNRTMLLGAAFTTEQSIEAAALCNPSMVAHPDQSNAPTGGLRFIMAVRGIAEGHQSSIGFRTGTIDTHGSVSVDPPEPRPVAATLRSGPFRKSTFHLHLRELGQDGESAASVLDALDEEFTADQLDHELQRLRSQRDHAKSANHAANRLRLIAERNYSATFPPETHESRRVLLPAMPVESHGLEDARFVRFTDHDRTVYFGTYTAHDGHAVTQQLLQTTDFMQFRSSPVLGPAAANKGLALFPRRIDGKYVALSRHDRESNFLAYTHDPHWWAESVPLGAPRSGWETIQVGNCGPPIETDAGWLVLTHGVGPMRTYSIGALLLDLHDPTKILGRLRDPLLAPSTESRDGYVPNVVYSCGALRHDDTIVIPYGVADSWIAVATVPLTPLLDTLLHARTKPRHPAP